MNREQARAYFAATSLTYSDLLKEDIFQLQTILDQHLKSYFVNGGNHAKNMAMKVSDIRKEDIQMKNGKLISARIQIDGSYFERREAITFSHTGFIGFGGELDGQNVQPILKAFIAWCDQMVDAKAATV